MAHRCHRHTSHLQTPGHAQQPSCSVSTQSVRLLAWWTAQRQPAVGKGTGSNPLDCQHGGQLRDNPQRGKGEEALRSWGVDAQLPEADQRVCTPSRRLVVPLAAARPVDRPVERALCGRSVELDPWRSVEPFAVFIPVCRPRKIVWKCHQ